MLNCAGINTKDTFGGEGLKSVYIDEVGGRFRSEQIKHRGGR